MGGSPLLKGGLKGGKGGPPFKGGCRFTKYTLADFLVDENGSLKKLPQKKIQGLKEQAIRPKMFAIGRTMLATIIIQGNEA